ncbi:MAG: hypothetical protein ACI4U2_06865, partial [Christensenellaceae bacterium]
KYYYRNPFIFSAVGALIPYVNGFLLFAVRKNVPVDYEAFLRRQQEEYRRRYTAQQGNPPADPFSRGEGQSQSGGSTPPPDPFEDGYSSAPTDPCGSSASDKSQTNDRKNAPPDPFDC